MTSKAPSTDKFIAMVSAKAEGDLRLCDFEPRAMLTTPAHEVKRARFPAIDYHNHLDAQEPKEILKVMDECGVERIVNITMRIGDEALEVMNRFRSAAPDRFATITWMDWTLLRNPALFTRPVHL